MARPRVLVVDPNPRTQKLVADALDGAGLDILSARDGAEAENLVSQNDIALALSSATLPKGSGYDVAKLVRAKHPRATVFLMSGGFEVFNARRAADCGVARKINLPFAPAQLRSQVVRSLGLDDLQALPEVEPDALTPVDLEEISLDAVTTLDEAPVRRSSADWSPPISEERIASFLPRDYGMLPRVAVDPEVVGPALERAILEVLPEVVDVVLRRSLAQSEGFRSLVVRAIEEALADQLPQHLGPLRSDDEPPPRG